MIDLHTHILPAIDDGAKSVSEALAMTEELLKQNITMAVCTPHFYPDRESLKDFVSKRTSAIMSLEKSKVTLIPGSETMLHESLFYYTELDALCIGTTRYLLLELPYDKKWDSSLFLKLEQLIRYYSIRPVIAHIERYPATRKKWIKKLIKMGCLIQLNTLSLSDHMYQFRAFRYLRYGYIDILSSDCHNMNKRPPNLAAGYEILKQNFSLDLCRQLQHNARCVINDIPIRDTKGLEIIAYPNNQIS